MNETVSRAIEDRTRIVLGREVVDSIDSKFRHTLISWSLTPSMTALSGQDIHITRHVFPWEMVR